MNSKEKAVVIFLCVSFLIGAGITFIRHKINSRNLEAITIDKTENDITTLSIDSVNNQEPDSVDKIMVININTASNKELEALPGIGPVIAQRIIDYRKSSNGFKSKEELLKVSGIGPKKFSAIKDKIIIK
jgi:competence protein ComEA